MRWLAALLAACVLSGPAAAAPSSVPPADFANFAFAQHPGARLPLDVMLRNSAGRPVQLGELFDGKPVVLDFEYDRCTTLCGVMLDQIAAALHSLPLKPGRDYRLVAIDIDPETTPQQAADFAVTHGAGTDVTVLTGDEAAILHIADAAGFPYQRDAATGQYAHPAGFLVVTPDGTISGYLLGFDWRALDLRLAIAEATKAKISAPAAAVLLLCYCYDPQTGRYDLAVGRLLKIAGAATLASIGALVWAVSRQRPA